MRFDKIIERGITARGKNAFLIRFRSNTIDGVVFPNDKEKKFHAKSPVNKKKL